MSWQEVLSDEKYQYVEKSKAWLSEISEKLLIFDKSLTAKSFYRTLMTLLEEWGTFTTSEDGRRKIYTKHNPEQYVIAVVDHIGLCLPEPGNTKKQEIDLISLELLTIIVFCWLSFKLLGLFFRMAWGAAKLIASILFVIALPLLVLCLIFAGGMLA